MSSFFNKKLPRSCKYCVYGKCSSFSDEVLCSKYGVTNAYDSCRKYKYDPLRRIPEKVKVADNYSLEDFEL